MQFQQIVAATDFSDVGDRAVATAKELSEREHAHLTLVHVLEPAPVPPPPSVVLPVMPYGSAEDLSAQRPEALRHLQSYAPQETATRVELGDPVREILRVADEQHADLIVIGTHGRRGAARFLLGSTAERVVRHAHCAVLVVH
jgi:universal stress protein A